MQADTGARGKVGILATLVEQGSEELRLVLDDVNRVEGSSPIEWRTEVLFTLKDYDRRKLLEGRLTKDELADIGMNLVVRLAALSKLSE